jgi:hypothetical protein
MLDSCCILEITISLLKTNILLKTINNMPQKTTAQLTAENDELKSRLAEAKDALRTLR